MDNLIPIYRLKSGHIEFNADLKLNFLMGLVFNDEGNLYIELHFDEFFHLEEFYRTNETAFRADDYKLICSTEDGHKFTAPKILMKSFPFHKSKGDFYCFDHIKIEKEIHDYPDDDLEDRLERVANPLKYVKLEGLRMHHSSHTYIKASRNYGTVRPEEIGGDKLWDHSEVSFQLDFKSFKFIIRQDDDGESIIEFQSPEHQYLAMPYGLWEVIKIDFLEFLSFLNGAAVYVRSEFYGQYYTVGKLDSQVKKLYSAQHHKPNRWNDFIPINNGWYRGDRLVSTAFMTCFEKYRELNVLLDLNTIIFYLNNAEQAPSMGERIFIQTILLERFSDRYAETLEGDETTIIEEEKYTPIHEELKQVLIKHKKQLGDNFHLINSKLGNLNNTKRKQTDFKFRALIKAANIEFTPEVEDLLISRHKIVHLGEIGKSKEARKNYFLMDKLLRKIIVNLIGYKGTTIDTGKHVQNPQISPIRTKQND